MMTTLWRIHIRPSGPKGDVDTRKSVALCLREQVIGAGWGFQGQSAPKSVKEYYRRAEKKFSGRGWKAAANAITNRDEKGMKVDDLVWMRDLKGNYYLGRITGGWIYNHEGEFGEHDIVNMRPCDLKKVGKRMPGVIVNRFVARQTVCRIHDSTGTALLFSKIVYNKIKRNSHYADTEGRAQSLFQLLSPEDLEDVVGLYLQHTRDYMLIPSSRSRRNDTIRYEYELVHRVTGKRAFVQVRSGERLNPDNYIDSDGKYYLFSVGGYSREENSSKVETLSKEKIEDFVYRQKKIMPYSIKFWIEYLEPKRS